MKFIFNTDYSENEIPRRMFYYDGAYIEEVFDSEDNEFIWEVLSKWKSVYHFTYCYESIDALGEGL